HKLFHIANALPSRPWAEANVPYRPRASHPVFPTRLYGAQRRAGVAAGFRRSAARQRGIAVLQSMMRMARTRGPGRALRSRHAVPTVRILLPPAVRSSANHRFLGSSVRWRPGRRVSLTNPTFGAKPMWQYTTPAAYY